MKLILAIVISTLSSTVIAQHTFISAGFTYGGAIPNIEVKNSTGKPGFGATLAIGHSIHVNNRVSIESQINYSLRHFAYGSEQRRDTTVSVEYQGTETQIPTFYTVNVNGNVHTHNVEFAALTSIQLGKYFSLDLGLFQNIAFVRRDATDITVRIGEGGAVPDIFLTENHGSDINRFEPGIKLGGSFHFNDKISLRFTGNRSITRFYREDYIKNDEGEPVSFYYTMLQTYLVYRFR